jgi:hypothetical protein
VEKRARRLVAAVQGDTLGVLLGRVRPTRAPKASREWLVRFFATRVRDENTAREALVCAMKPSNRRGLLRLVQAALLDARGIDDFLHQSNRALVTLTQLAGPDASWQEVERVARDVVDEDFSHVWRVGLRSGLDWSQAHEAAKKLALSEVWEMAAALCRNVHIQDTQELWELCAVLVKDRSVSRPV